MLPFTVLNFIFIVVLFYLLVCTVLWYFKRPSFLKVENTVFPVFCYIGISTFFYIMDYAVNGKLTHKGYNLCSALTYIYIVGYVCTVLASLRTKIKGAF